MILRDQNSMLELATYFQRGLHSGLDVISDPDVHVYDSLLTLQLKERGITLPHRPNISTQATKVRLIYS